MRFGERFYINVGLNQCMSVDILSWQSEMAMDRHPLSTLLCLRIGLSHSEIWNPLARWALRHVAALGAPAVEVLREEMSFLFLAMTAGLTIIWCQVTHRGNPGVHSSCSPLPQDLCTCPRPCSSAFPQCSAHLRAFS